MSVFHEIRVRYAETDQMGVVYYANYLVWFEIGRVELMRAAGFAYSELETKYECIIPVIDASCRYRASAHYDDEILIETWPSLLRESVIKFAYRIWRKEKEGEKRKLLAEGETAHVICDRKMNRKALPVEVRTAFQALVEK